MTPPSAGNARYLAIRRFRKFQHYKDRGVPWIKLYGSTLTDAQFIQMPEAAQAQLMKLWSLTSLMGYPLPNNPRLLAGKIGTTGKFFLPLLIELGFLTPCDTLDGCETIARESLDKCEHDDSGTARASARSRGEGEVELERDAPNYTTGSASDFVDDDVARRLPTAADRTAYARLIAIAPEPETWRAEIRASLDGMSGHHVTTPAQMGEAVRDYIGNGDAKNRNLRQFRRYLEQAGKPRPRSNGRTPRPRGDDLGFDKIGGDE